MIENNPIPREISWFGKKIKYLFLDNGMTIKYFPDGRVKVYQRNMESVHLCKYLARILVELTPISPLVSLRELSSGKEMFTDRQLGQNDKLAACLLTVAKMIIK